MRDFQLSGRSPVISANGMCATSHPLAARTAVRILEDGGNAVDAAIGAAVLLGICEPQSTGIGGDCFVLLKPPGEDRIVALNGSGRAPAAAKGCELRGQGMLTVPSESVHAVTIPGAVDAFCQLSADWGRLELAACLAPAIEAAEEGVPVAERVAFDWQRAADRLQGDAREHYLMNGQAPRQGMKFRAPGQAEVLRRVARAGRAGFYEGEVAEDMVNCLREQGGCHSPDDFAATACSYDRPISGEYGGYEILEHPPNGQGAAAILMANILSNFKLPKSNPFGVRRTHLECEAAKLALDARDRFLADPDHITRLKHMLSPKTAAELAALIDPHNPLTAVSRAADALHRETVLLVVVDRDLMAVTMIYSIFSSFGSGIASSKFGINFQNRGAGFTLAEGHPNELNGGKRPLHTIIPAMLRHNGRVVMPFGVMGGQYQAVGHVRFITNLVDYGMNPQSALDGPRSFPEDGSLLLERGYRREVFSGLRELGHNVAEPETPHGGGQAIRIDYGRGILEGASDHRKDGCALGY
ncbi:MAG: gamma-glutamyltransferase family protein [Rhodobacteraceae bacterium]|nr:gamma-glutamyltransferase family protein [Paracoccaceae bacterium]